MDVTQSGCSLRMGWLSKRVNTFPKKSRHDPSVPIHWQRYTRFFWSCLLSFCLFVEFILFLVLSLHFVYVFIKKSSYDSRITGSMFVKSVWGFEWHCANPVLFFQSQEIDVIIGKDRESFYTSGLDLGSKKCSVLRDSLHDDGDWTMDIRTKSTGGEPTYNLSVGRAGKGKSVH